MQREQLIAATSERVVIVTNLVENFIMDEMLEDRREEIPPLLSKVSQLADIERVRVFDREGRIKFSSHLSDIGRRISPSRLERYTPHAERSLPVIFEQEERGQAIHVLVKPIPNRPDCHRCHDPRHAINGFLHIDFSLAKARGQIASIHTFILLSAIVTIASLAFGLWLLLSRLVNRPVSALMKTMRKAEGGDLDARVQVKSEDELGRLGESFNYMISSLQDAKQRLETEYQRQLEQAEKMASLGQLASAVAHEVRNPLGGVSGAMQVLAEDYPADDPKREVIEEMLRQIRRLDKTVKDLLSYARPASPAPVPCNVGDLVERALLFIRQQVKDSSVSVVTEYGEGLLQIQVDPQQIQQVILNIALNAVQAMPDQGTLTVRTRAIGDQGSAVRKDSGIESGPDFVEVAISDTGNGIHPENLKRVFQPFFTTKHKGTGLGLPICQRIVEQHGGTIYLESGVGRGTTVSVHLPVQRSES
jgi:signal transduction histidine kinase